ncbi:asparagine synthase-related protein [Sulfitobacter sabulilitoris]|uniref:NAD(+) synthase n=1 Tax=Sulfitobacter sabulilitoris TaxID=2562655 RepID=A0A5S3PLW7_9RHOB|nr:asparagine synthase-related protein [Sulfitobacter sabulilitoris]TMM55408.1 NAD(+) synthase [Sulfitobacter sabulilitoris]
MTKAQIQTAAAPDLRIDTDRAIRRICDDLQRRVARDASNGVILGLSGGLDSSVLAALAVRALGTDAVAALYLYDRDSAPLIATHAREMADRLGLRLEQIDITGDMARLGIYAPLFIKALRLSPRVARISAGAYRRICGETPFASTLRAGGGEVLTPWHKRFLYDHTMRHVDHGFAQRHVFRRQVLERLARRRRLTVIGAANRSEVEVGWFVKDGIDDLPVQPMTGLFKTQVRQLARALDLPDRVRDQSPSPDMARGVTDEFGIAHTYRIVDIVIDGLDRGLGDAAIADLGVPRAEIADIRRLMHLSAWKRTSPHEPPPVSGAAGSDLRIAVGAACAAGGPSAMPSG